MKEGGEICERGNREWTNISMRALDRLCKAVQGCANSDGAVQGI